MGSARSTTAAVLMHGRDAARCARAVRPGVDHVSGREHAVSLATLCIFGGFDFDFAYFYSLHWILSAAAIGSALRLLLPSFFCSYFFHLYLIPIHFNLQIAFAFGC